MKFKPFSVLMTAQIRQAVVPHWHVPYPHGEFYIPSALSQYIVVSMYRDGRVKLKSSLKQQGALATEEQFLPCFMMSKESRPHYFDSLSKELYLEQSTST